MIVKAQRYCPTEKRMVLAERRAPNHLLHLILTILTGGLWAIVWIILALSSKPYLCPSCGGKTRQVGAPVSTTTIVVVIVVVLVVLGSLGGG